MFSWLTSHLIYRTFESSSTECPKLISENINEPPTREIPINWESSALNKAFDNTFVLRSAEEINEIFVGYLRRRVGNPILVIALLLILIVTYLLSF